MGNHRPTILIKVLSVTTVLLGSVLFGYGMQNQVPSQSSPTQPATRQGDAQAQDNNQSQEAGQPQNSGETNSQAETKSAAQQTESKSPSTSSSTASSTSPSASSSPTQSKPNNRNVESVSSSRPRFGVTTVAVGGGFGRFHRRGFFSPFIGFGYSSYGPYPPYYYDPYYYGPYSGPYYPPAARYGYGYGVGRGEIKLSVEPGIARVYVDDAFAGRAEDLKHIYLEPGVHTLSVSAPGRATYAEKLYVLSGKTIKIKTTLEPEGSRPAAQREDKK
jgi:hypothetical protein